MGRIAEGIAVLDDVMVGVTGGETRPPSPGWCTAG
jgi:hypothetical protein